MFRVEIPPSQYIFLLPFGLLLLLLLLILFIPHVLKQIYHDPGSDQFSAHHRSGLVSVAR